MGASLTAITPRFGSLHGKTPVTLTGIGFSSSTQVKIAGVACTSVLVSGGGTSLTCLTGDGLNAHRGDVEVSDSNGSYKLSNAFAYNHSLYAVAGTPSSTGAVLAYGIDPDTGALSPLGAYDTDKGSFGITVVGEKFVYVSNRIAGTISMFAITPTGELGPLGNFPVGSNLWNLTSDRYNHLFVASDVNAGATFMMNISPNGTLNTPVEYRTGYTYTTALAATKDFLFAFNYEAGVALAWPLNSVSLGNPPTYPSVPANVVSAVISSDAGYLCLLTSDPSSPPATAVHSYSISASTLIPDGSRGIADLKAVALTPQKTLLAVTSGQTAAYNPAGSPMPLLSSVQVGGTAIVVEPQGRFAYVADQSGNITRLALDPNTGVLSVQPAVPAQPNVRALAVD